MTKKKKTPLERMRDIHNDREQGVESQHYNADRLLCSLVREFVPNGREVVKEYQFIQFIEKWYA